MCGRARPQRKRKAPARLEDERYCPKATRIDTNSLGSEAHLDALFNSAMGEEVLTADVPQGYEVH